MLALFSTIAGLGLAAVDVVGIAFMPILLAQDRGVRRSWVFLSGSLVSLLAMGIAFTTGVGKVVVHLTRRMPWLVPGIEVAGGLIVIALGVVMLARAARGTRARAPDSLVRRLTLPEPLLFAFGALLVAVQSVIDVVFVVAMVEIGTKGLPTVAVVGLVTTYAVTALAIQVAVVVVYLSTPRAQRTKAMAAFNDWLARSGELWAGIVALVLGAGLLLLTGPDLVAAVRRH